MREVLNLDRLRALAPDTAAALLAARQLDGAGALDATIHEGWLQLNPSHIEAWEDVQRTVAVFEDTDGDELLAAMRKHALGKAAKPRERFPAWAAAAVVLLLVTGGVFAIPRLIAPDAPPAVVASSSVPAPWRPTGRYASPRGRPQTFKLPDGSEMILDTQSVVEIAFVGGRRDLRLDRGRAYFAVAHDARRPFSVRAGSRTIVALGTRFDVKILPRGVQVVLAEGRVSIETPGETKPNAVLAPGQRYSDSGGERPMVSPASLDEALSWRRGVLTFDNETLATAVAELNRYSRDQFLVRDPRVASMRISGGFQTGDTARFGRTVAEIHPVRLVRLGPDQVEITMAR